MSVPKVELTVLDNQLGIRAPADAVLAIVATAKTGTANTPANYTRVEDLQTEFTLGPLVEVGAYAIEHFGLTVKAVRSGDTVAGAFGTLELGDFTGTSVPAIDSSTEPGDEFEVMLDFPAGGTLGVSGITYRWSLDGGRTKSAATALGTATSITIPDSGGVKVLFQPPSNALVALANDIRTQALAHFAATASVHGAADTTSDDGIGIAATTNATALTLANTLRTGILAHLGRGATVHLALDAVSGVGIPAAATTHQEARTLLLALKVALNAHEIYLTSHTAADTNLVTVASPSAGTIVALAALSFPTTAPQWNNDELGTALDALKVTSSPWTFLMVYGDCDDTAVSTIQTKLEAMAAAGRDRRAMAHVRKPDAGETEATYMTALEADFADSTARRVVLTGGYAKIDSSVSRRRYRRPPALALAALAASVTEEVDLAELPYGPLPGVVIHDSNGNPDEHDEFINPGLDDLRFCTLRSWEARAGVWVNNPRLFAPVGSDFLYLQYGRVVDTASRIAREELEPILSRGVFPKTDGTGQIETETAVSIEGQINGRLNAALVGTRKAAAVVFTLSRTDNVLQTGEIGWQVRVVPLAYIKKLKGTVALVASAKSTITVTG